MIYIVPSRRTLADKVQLHGVNTAYPFSLKSSGDDECVPRWPPGESEGLWVALGPFSVWRHESEGTGC